VVHPEAQAQPGAGRRRRTDQGEHILSGFLVRSRDRVVNNDGISEDGLLVIRKFLSDFFFFLVDDTIGKIKIKFHFVS
jgi:hypothetical protein